MRRRDPLALLAGLAALVGLIGSAGLTSAMAEGPRVFAGVIGLALILVLAWSHRPRREHLLLVDWLPPALAAGLAASLVLGALDAHLATPAPVGFWAAAIAVWLVCWRLVGLLVAARPRTRLARAIIGVAAPLVFGATLVFLWEACVRATGVPGVILPAPSAIGLRLMESVPTLAADFAQTVKGVAAGFLAGCASGFLTAVLIDRVPFLQRGLLPIGTLVSALPIVGVAPIMVMWFGFDWQSKAAVVVVMTFFPMLVNANAGLAASGPIERDLMRTYAAGYAATLLKLRLPMALPFVFNGLKICSTLALIGAIVAEFFGTPIVGMGFRISSEVGRMNIDMVWATIVVAAVFGSLLYGLIALVERRMTFWHASYRQGAQ